MGINSKLSNRIKLKHMKMLSRYRKKLRKNPQLHSLFIEMTSRCNERCRHCGSSCTDSELPGLLSKEEIYTLLDEVAEDFDISKLKLCITGGEPLLRPDFMEIMEYANSKGYSWGMTSNGLLITPKVAAELRRTGMKTISISLDGLEQSHDWFRQVKGSYQRSVQGIRNLINEGGFSHIQITTVIHKQNIKELPQMYETFKLLGVNSWRVINIEPIGRAKLLDDLLLSADEYKELFSFIESMRFEDPQFEVVYGCSHFLGIDLEREIRKWYFLCNAGIYTASVMYNGDVGACLDIERRPETIQGNIRQTRFSKIWKEEFEIFRTDYRKCSECKKCKNYRYCAGESFHTWNFDEMKPNICMSKVLEQ